MDKNKAIKTISRWIDFRLKAGYKIAGIGFKGMGEIRISFKKKKDNIHNMVCPCIDEMHEANEFLNKKFNIKEEKER